jgi:hypothetical protein
MFNPALADALNLSAAERDAKTRSRRERICAACFREGTDQYLGGIHSELACMRCGVKPCVGAVVEKYE